METNVILEKFKGNLKKYSADFSPEKLWEKLKATATKLGAKLTYTIVKLYYIAMDPNISISDKLIITAALGYFILPVDIVPDFLPGGLIDDGFILKWVLSQMECMTTDDVRQAAKTALARWFSPEVVKELGD